ncbi:MAG: hypothetical protein WC992_04425 [Acholeplasmataceae bacterium]|jgi:phospholipase/carboxylesterase|nr:hypothetical protein [Acholeplasmataceae bacterium]
MEHIYIPGKSERMLVLLHGTGGDENDLIPIAKYMDSDAHILSLRGRIKENGMNRFFKRVSPGILDYVSLEEETDSVYQFIRDSISAYQLSLKLVTILGYSNGANMATSILLTQNPLFTHAILLRPMMLQIQARNVSLKSSTILLMSGKTDPNVPAKDPLDLMHLFNRLGASTELHWENTSHQLSQQEIVLVKTWYQNRIKD